MQHVSSNRIAFKHRLLHGLLVVCIVATMGTFSYARTQVRNAWFKHKTMNKRIFCTTTAPHRGVRESWARWCSTIARCYICSSWILVNKLRTLLLNCEPVSNSRGSKRSKKWISKGSILARLHVKTHNQRLWQEMWARARWVRQFSWCSLGLVILEILVSPLSGAGAIWWYFIICSASFNNSALTLTGQIFSVVLKPVHN